MTGSGEHNKIIIFWRSYPVHWVTGHVGQDLFRPYFLAETSLISWTFRPKLWTFRPTNMAKIIISLPRCLCEMDVCPPPLCLPLSSYQILMYWYSNQCMYVRWAEVLLHGCHVLNGVLQGGSYLHIYLMYIYGRSNYCTEWLSYRLRSG